MASAVAAWHALVWFIDQSVVVGGLGLVYFVVPFVLLLGAMIIGCPRYWRRPRRRIVPLVGLPAIWLFVGFWGGLFWLDPHAAIPNPDWARYPPALGPWLSLAASALFVWGAKGARLFAASYALLNLYFALSVSMLATMAVTDAWL